MERENFDTWLLGKPDWNEISFRYNTGREYQHKQDLKAVFGTTFKYIEQKFKAYYQEFKQVPNETLDNLIYTFRQHFPLHGRIEGVPYFDELIETMVKKYSVKTIKTGPTAGQVALFLYYLINSKYEVLGKGKDRFQPLLKKYRFDISFKNVNNLYSKIGSNGKNDPMNLKNLAYIIRELLEPFPAALQLAKNDYYEKEREV